MALSIRLSDSGEDFLEVYASGFSTAVKVINWYIDNAYDGSVSSNESDWPYWTFTRLEPGTTYTIKCAFFDSAGTKLDVIEKNFTTDEAVVPGTIVIDSDGTTATMDSINLACTAEGGDGTYWVQFYVEEYDTGAGLYHDSYTFTLRPGQQKLLSWKFTGLKPSTRYRLRVNLYNDDTGSREDYDTDTIWTEAPARPPDWEWDSVVRKGVAVPTNKVSGTENDYAATFLTVDEWLAFIDRIEEFADYCNVVLQDTPLQNARFNVVVGYPMTAVQLNAARSLIRALDYTTAPPAAIVRGGVVTADFINGLKDSLNSIP